MRFAFALVLLLALVPPPPTAAAPRAELEPAPCPIDVSAELLGTRQLTCRSVSVPLQRRDPATDSGTLRLAVAVLSNGAANGDPVVYLAGGPGASALRELTLLLQVQPALSGLTADRDWIFIDQRGTGFSGPDLSCPEVSLGPRSTPQLRSRQRARAGRALLPVARTWRASIRLRTPRTSPT